MSLFKDGSCHDTVLFHPVVEDRRAGKCGRGPSVDFLADSLDLPATRSGRVLGLKGVSASFNRIGELAASLIGNRLGYSTDHQEHHGIRNQTPSGSVNR